MNIQLKSIGELAATLTAGAIAVKAKGPALKGAATLAAGVLTVLVWWKNQPITEAMPDMPAGDYMAVDNADDVDGE